MDTVANCDPCSFDIQDLAITHLRHRTIKPTKEVVFSPRLQFEHFNPAGTYDVLPFYNATQTRNQLKEYLTFPNNPFLTTRFQRFNKAPPTKVLQLEVMTYKKRPKSPVRRKVLNGEPMSNDGRERYPVPTDPTTRKSIKRENFEKNRLQSMSLMPGDSASKQKTSKKV